MKFVGICAATLSLVPFVAGTILVNRASVDSENLGVLLLLLADWLALFGGMLFLVSFVFGVQ